MRKKLKALIKGRHILLKQRRKYYKKNDHYDVVTEGLLDGNSKSVINFIKDNYKKLRTEMILESYSELGSCPNLIYDDNGNWAISEEGVQSLRLKKDQDFQTSLAVEAKFFQPTIREALVYWIFNQ